MIDSDYTGNIGIILTNFTACDVDIKIGDRIAQIIILKTAERSFEELSEFTDKLLEV